MILFSRHYLCAITRFPQRARSRIAIAILSSGCVFGSGTMLRADENTAPQDTASKSAQVQTRKMVIHPKNESKPSLKMRLLPDSREQLDGNAALFYLKAMGFFEQDTARAQIREMIKKGAEQEKLAGKEGMDYPPYSYLELHPRDYPKTEVQDYLKLLSFQEPWLREARRHRHFSMDRNIHLSDDPMGYLLPEIQSIRELARSQSIRCRLAIAENRIEDAIEIIGQQVTMSRHIGMDDFLVSYLVGCAVLAIAVEDTMLLQEHAQCPNLYWAFAQLPGPLLDTERCIAVEGQFIYLQIPRLKEVDTDPKPPAYWTEFVAEFAKRTADIDEYNDSDASSIVSKVQGEKRVESIQESIAANLPQAKQYLLNRGLLTKESMEAYPGEQLVFLAMRDYYDMFRDDYFKWLHVPYHVAIEGMRVTDLQMKSKREREEFGWFTGISYGLLPNIEAFFTAVTRARQRIAVIQAIEAIRMAGAENGGKPIDSLDRGPVPVPNDPFTGKPFSYQVDGDVAVLSSEFPEHAPVRIELRFAK
jgi:hypothetical protein